MVEPRDDDDLIGQKGAEPVCRTCGSPRVLRDAWAEWNSVTGMWELSQVFDDGYCQQCEEPTKFFQWRKTDIDPKAEIRRLNDALRTGNCTDGTIVVTSGVNDRGPEFVRVASEAVKAFSDFTPDNDPHNEHDFGTVEVDGEKLFFKLDYFNLGMTAHSPDPADPCVTRRVLTIMLASEY